jgi:protein TonB
LIGIGVQISAQDAPPRALTQAIPEHPKVLREQRIVGSATLICRITAQGDVTEITVEQASREEFGAAAIAAVGQWKYHPAIRAGQPKAVKVSIPIEFALSDRDLVELENNRVKEVLPPGPPVILSAETDEPPQLLKEIRPNTPKTLQRARQMGQATMGFIVDENGIPRDIHPVSTTHAECSEAAAAAIRKWRFTPGKKNGAAARVMLDVPIVFFPENSWANGLRAKPGVKLVIPTAEIEATKADPASAHAIYIPPRPIKTRPPEFPQEMAVRGRTGEVTVEFIINKHGAVTHVRATGNTNPFFATVVERAVSYWEFTPGTRNGVPVNCHATQQMVFAY